MAGEVQIQTFDQLINVGGYCQFSASKSASSQAPKRQVLKKPTFLNFSSKNESLNLRTIQTLLEHSSSKTTELHIRAGINRVQSIVSPIDLINL